MAQRTTCPHCGNQVKPTMGTGPTTCYFCDERMEFTPRDGWVIAPVGDYRPMDSAQANEVINRYTPGQYVSMGAPHTAELVEAYMVLSGASLASIHNMREQVLGPGVNG